MQEKPLWTQAEERVSQRHPLPAHEPVSAGIMGMFITGIVVAAFIGFAGIDEESVATAIIFTCALGYIAPYWYFRQVRKEYLMKVQDEYLSLRDRKEADAQRP